MKKIIFSALAMMFIAIGMTVAQQETQEKLKTTISLNYYKNSDDTKTLKAKVFSKKEKKFIPINNITIHFYYNGIENNLGDAQTNENGDAVLDIPREKNLMDSLGSIFLIAKFDGDNTYKSAEEEITVKDAQLTISVSEIDSVKTISVTASEISQGKETPLEGVDVVLYVKRLFGDLKIGEVSLENGKGSIAFSYTDLPGDSVGTIALSVKIEGSDDYGNIEKKESIAWGVPVHYTKENSGIDLALLYDIKTPSPFDSTFLGIISVIVILIFITIVMYKRS